MPSKGIPSQPPQATATDPAASSLAGWLTKQQLWRWVPAAVLVAGVVLAVVIWLVVRDPADVHVSSFAKAAIPLLNDKAVQDELKLTPQQLTAANKLEETRTQAMAPSLTAQLDSWQHLQKNYRLLLANEKALGKILDAGQLKRLMQIHLQQRGGKRTWGDDDVANELGLTKTQQDSISDIQKQYRKDRSELGRADKGNAAQKEAAQKKAEELHAAHEDQLLGVLTAAQQSKWQDMIGEPFAGLADLPRGGQAGRGAPGNAGGRAGRGARNAGG
jgi:hypothetical protein